MPNRDDVVQIEYPIPGVETETKEPEVKGESESLDFDKSPHKFVLDGDHNWVQRGYYAHCTACPLEHGLIIGPDKIMVGVDDNNLPILKTRTELGHG